MTLELPAGYGLHRAPLTELSGLTWHEISRLRQDVFVVEQDCPYPDQDARDAEPNALHLWVSYTPAGGPVQVVATLRLLSEPDGATRRIGRVATDPDHRGRGLMGHLMLAAAELCGSAAIVLDAQAHLEDWYSSFGFVADGPGFLEDGIPHVPMLRAPGASA